MNNNKNTVSNSNETEEQIVCKEILKSSKTLAILSIVISVFLFLAGFFNIQNSSGAIYIIIAFANLYISDAIHNCMNGFALIVKNSKEKVIIGVKNNNKKQ